MPMTFQEMQKILDRIEDIPTLPTIASKIMSTANTPTSSAKQIAEILNRDQALTFKVLRMANSAYYAVTDPVKTVDRAIVVIGFNRIKNIVMRVSAMSALSNKKVNSPLFNMTRFWEHSIGVAICSSIIAKMQGLPKPEEIFTAGLLHDIGKLILAQYLTDSFNEVAKKVYREGISFIDAERAVIGVDHTHIGKWLSNKWRLSEELKLVIAEHHHPPSDTLILGEYAISVVIVYLADVMCRKVRVGFGGDDLVPEIKDHIWNLLDKSKIDLDKVAEKLIDEQQLIQEYLGILT